MTAHPHCRKLARARRAFVAFLAAALLAAALLGGCDDQPTVPPPPAGAVTIQLDHTVGGADLRFDSRDYVNAAGNPYSIYELRYFVSNLELVRIDGSAHRAADVHLRDAARPETRAWQATRIPDNHYVAVRFTFGLDGQHNLPSGLPSTVENNRMFWPEVLGGGYHFMMLDGFYADSTGTNASWMAHLGRLVSMAQPTPVETAFQVELPVVLHVAGDAHTVRVVMDVNGWFAPPNVYDFNTFGAFNMDDPVALSYLRDNGRANVFSIGAVARAPR